MSYVHMIIVPKDRIYNALSLRPGHSALLQKMQKVAARILILPRVKVS
jgi:hypothetical protein